MVHHIALLKLKSSVTPEKVENLMVEMRIRLLKVPEVINLRCGKKIDDQNNAYDMFYSIDFESLNKLRIAQDSAIWIKFKLQILDPQVDQITAYQYEMEPGKDTRYS
jgi:Stress responsive A/B Barrel Domain